MEKTWGVLDTPLVEGSQVVVEGGMHLVEGSQVVVVEGGMHLVVGILGQLQQELSNGQVLLEN